MEGLPRLAQLRKDLGEEIHIMTLNIDFDEEGEPGADLINSAKRMLQDKGMHTSQNWLCRDTAKQVFATYEILSFPTLLFFKDGELKDKLEGESNYEDEVVKTARRWMQ